MSAEGCEHRPTLTDRLLYYTHIIIEPCRFVSHTSDLFIRPCLVADWIELGFSCPDCTLKELGDYLIVHPEEDE